MPRAKFAPLLLPAGVSAHGQWLPVENPAMSTQHRPEEDQTIGTHGEQRCARRGESYAQYVRLSAKLNSQQDDRDAAQQRDDYLRREHVQARQREAQATAQK